ncbi:MAG TPA: LpqB family beta-propeller domain-containing protein, partial [Vicinamibacterales bacterium]|nr:LpqB family beta-propeller domain-containing protein [Vicinamibacterales bacterium]
MQLAEVPRLVDPQLSPDGRSVAYMLATADWGQDRLVYHLWRKDAGAAAVALTSEAPNEIPGGTRWSPDGSSIAYLRGGQVWVVPAKGGAARAITKHATGITNNPGPSWSPDGTTIYFVAGDPQTPEERERERVKDDLVKFEENYRMRHLWSVDVASGAEKQLTTGKLTVASFRLSRDGSKIVLERSTTPYTDDAHLGEVWITDASGANAVQITRNNVEENQPELSPDNSQVLFLANTNAKFEPDYNGALFLVPASGGAPKLAAPDFPYAVDQASWSPDGKSILLVANMGVHSEIFTLDPATGDSKQLTDGRHFIVPTWAVVPSAGKMLIQFDEPDR